MLMVYLPLVFTRWIHFACVFVLFGSSFFWLYEKGERSFAGPHQLPRTLRVNKYFATHRRAHRGDLWHRLARIDPDQHDALLWQHR